MPSTLPDPSVVTHPVSSAGQIFLEVAVAAAIIVVLIAAARIQRRWGTSMGFVVVLGTLLASGVEVVFNTAANFWYYQPHQNSLFSTWDRSLPIWALGSYVPFYGGLGMIGWLLLERGATRRRMAVFAGAVWLFAVVTEISLVGVHVYQYYGPQPYEIARFPIWISAANAGICASVAVGAALLSRSLHGWVQWLAVLLGPSLVSSFLLGTTFPLVSVLHANHPSTVLLYVGGAVSSVLAVAVCALVLRLVPATGLRDSLLPGRAAPPSPPANRLDRPASGSRDHPTEPIGVRTS
ncbi:MAG: hypothetical protein M3O28_00235 [Actinomycetota bacterium]|nr:hypothetical protein [Actinomycetota bacterium]